MTDDVLTWADDHPRAKVLARTRAAILAAARQLFLAQGFERTTMERVAADASIGIMTLYRHFRSKEPLFRAVMEGECGMRERLGGDAVWTKSPTEALTLFGEAVIGYLCEPDQVALRRAVVAEVERFPDLGRVWWETGPARGVADVTSYLEARTQAGDLECLDARALAERHLALLDRLPHRVLLGLDCPTPDEIHAEAACIAALVLGQAQRPFAPEPTSPAVI